MKKNSVVSRSQAMVEPLESRQLMSAVVDVRLPGGGKSVIDPTVGQKIDFQVWVTVTGSDTNTSNEGLEIAVGSLLSTDVSGGVAAGTMTFTVASPFTGTSAQNGTQQDLDKDGDLDVGSNDTSTSDNYIFARDDSMDTSGTAVTKGQAFEIGTGSFTVTKLLSGIETDLVFRPRGVNSTILDQEDGTPLASPDITLTQGTGIKLQRTPSSSINGRVFDDKNGSGVFDGDDTGISGFRVFLDENSNGVLDSGEISKPVSTTGTYHFTSVPPGTYKVREVFRDGWRQSFPALGYYQVTLGYNETAKTQSFANTDRIVIKGTVFMDANRSKVMDPGEPGLAGWTLYDDANNNSVLDTGESTSVSDVNGNYRFFNLPPAHYNIRIVQQAHYELTTPAGGAHAFTLGPAGTKSNQNFGEKKLKT